LSIVDVAPEAKAVALMPREAYALARPFPVMLQASTARKRARLYGIAADIARRIASEKMSWSDPFALLIRAAIASGQNKPEQGVSLLSEAVEGFELADMALYAAASRRRLGQMLGGERGAELIAEQING
jgi:hypothetical protein